MENLSLGQRQMVEIAKALSLDARLLIMDEPTSSLSAHETETLFQVIADLKSRGLSILYISHRLGEVTRIADRVVALRDGKNAGELAKHEINHDAMVRLMVGRDLSQVFRAPARERRRRRRCACMDLQTRANPKHRVSFSVRRGEIVGMAGLVGSGRTEVLRALFGVEPPVAGDIRVHDKPLAPQHPREAADAGLALVPEDRKALGVFLPESVALERQPRRAAAPRARRLVSQSVRRGARCRRCQRATCASRPPRSTPWSAPCPAATSRRWRWVNGWRSSRSVLLLDEPTRGVDVGAKREIYQIMEKLAADGVAILFVSSEMEEVLAMSDRVLVMHEGALTGELQRDELSEEAVMRLATGRRKPIKTRMTNYKMIMPSVEL